MVFIISNYSTHGYQGHWDVTVALNESETDDWKVSPDIIIEGWGPFLKRAKKDKIESISIYCSKETIIPEDRFTPYFEVADYETDLTLNK